MQDDVVAGAPRLVGVDADLARLVDHLLLPAGGGDVLALVDVSRAWGPEAGIRSAEVVWPGDREGVQVHSERLGLTTRGGAPVVPRSASLSW